MSRDNRLDDEDDGDEDNVFPSILDYLHGSGNKVPCGVDVKLSDFPREWDWPLKVPMAVRDDLP